MSRRIAVMRVLPGLGDFLCLIPALRALRAGEPDAHVTFLGMPRVRPLVERFPHYIDEMVDLPCLPGLTDDPGDPAEVLGRLELIQDAEFDLLIQLHGSGIVSNPLAVLMGAKRTAGFYLPEQFVPDPETFLPYPADQPEIRRHLALVEHLGYESKGDHLEFPLTEADRRNATDLLERHGIGEDEKYVVIHPGASTDERRWPADRFAAIGNVMANRGYRVVITGSETEADVASEVAATMRHDPVDLAGQTDLGSLAAVLCRAVLLIGNDTGVSHVASACVTPSVVLFAGSGGTEANAFRWGPLNRDRHIALRPKPNKNGSAASDQEPLVCAVDVMDRCLRDGCTLEERTDGRPPGKINVADVQAAAERLLTRQRVKETK